MVRVGVHCPVEKALISVIQWTLGIQGNTAQFFLQNPHTYKPRIISKKEWKSFNQHLQNENISPVFIHAPYVVNLCSLDDQVREKSCLTVQRLLLDIQADKDFYLIIHIGYHGGSGFDNGMSRFQNSLRHIEQAVPIQQLVIENSSGQTNAMGGSLDEISCLVKAFPDIRLCIDTAHLWGYGYSPSDRFLIRKLSLWLEKNILKVIHLNNSRDEKGSKRDHHAKLNQGKITSSVLKTFAKRFQGIPYILETPKNSLEEDQEQIKIIKEWLGQ